MDKIVKIGGTYVSIPEGTTDITFNDSEEKEAHHESINLIEDYDETPLPYETTIPPQFQIAAINAEANISKIAKPWVKTAYIILFIIFPSLVFLSICIHEIFFSKEDPEWGLLIFMTFIYVPIIAYYLLLWNKNNK